MQSDAMLVQACLSGQKEAFAALVTRYQRPVCALALDILRDRHCAADISQDAFLKAYQNLPALRSPEAFGPWLLKITRRCALDFARGRPKDSPLESAAAIVFENRNGSLNEDQQVLLAAVLKLPKAENQVILLRYFAGHSVKDVSLAVGRSIGTVTKQLSRAHFRLRRILKESRL